MLGEDNPGDVYLVRKALESSGLEFELSVIDDGEDVLARVERIGAGHSACPDLILLDINLPKISGDVALQRMRENEGPCAAVPVVMITSSNSPRDRESANRHGANAYFLKPSDYDEYMKLGAVVAEALGNRPDAPPTKSAGQHGEGE